MDYYDSAAQNEWRGQMQLIARAAGDPAALVALIRDAVWAVDPDQPIIDIGLATDIVAESTAEPRFYLLLMSVFAGSAMLLAAVGVYGVTSYTVSRRTAEIGIRMSLGARSADAFRLILRRAIAITVIGLGVGLASALALARLLRGLLFEVSPTDPATYVIIAMVLFGVAMIASLVPAIRATRIDPLTALRSE
jgi:putative ABC transport system permease protein